jgi:hypothetical protein
VAGSNIFEWLSGELESRTQLSRLEARGTIRLVLKDAGLDASSVRPLQMQVVLQRLLPGALKKRGVSNPEVLCNALAAELRAEAEAPTETPYDVFERLDSQTTRRPKS